MINSVENFLKQYDLLNKSNTFIIGFSGGCDSFCLLDVMCELKKKYKFNVLAAHLNHNWRGEEAHQEQLRCKDISENYGIKFITKTLEKQSKISEETARILRYDFFKDCADSLENSFVLTAHNGDDNVETVIYRIAKGTGIKGLVGIPEKIEKDGVTYLRPLLNTSRKKIETYCREKKLIPNHDSSNENTKYKRNFIRKKIIPLLRELNPNVQKAINSLSQIAYENELVLNNLIEKTFENNKIISDVFKNLDESTKSFVIHKFLIKNNLEYDRKKIFEILKFVNNPLNIKKKYSIAKNLWLIFDEKYIKTISLTGKREDEILINDNGIYKTPFGGTLEIKDFNEITQNFPKETALEAIVDLSMIKGTLTLRTRRNGDIIQPFGMSGKMKLKKYLIQKKIPQEERDNLILLALNNEVLWVIGVGISEKLKVANKPTSMFKYDIID